MKDAPEVFHGTRTGAFFHSIKPRSHFSATGKIFAVFNPLGGVLLVLPVESEAERTFKCCWSLGRRDDEQTMQVL